MTTNPPAEVEAALRRAVSYPNHGKPWSDEDRQHLVWEWEHASMDRLVSRFGRSPISIWDMAIRNLGLRAVPNGYESVGAAAIRTGYEPDQLWRIFDLAGLHPRRCISDPHRENRGERERRFVDPERVDDAVRLWNATEFISPLAKRLRIDRRRLRHLLGSLPADFIMKSPWCRYLVEPEAGLSWRVPSELAEKLVDDWRRRAKERFSCLRVAAQEQSK